MNRGGTMGSLVEAGSERCLRALSDGRTKTTLLGDPGRDAAVGEPGRDDPAGLDDRDDDGFFIDELPTTASNSILASTLSVWATRCRPSAAGGEPARSAGANCWSSVKPSEPRAARNSPALRMAEAGSRRREGASGGWRVVEKRRLRRLQENERRRASVVGWAAGAAREGAGTHKHRTTPSASASANTRCSLPSPAPPLVPPHARSALLSGPSRSSPSAQPIAGRALTSRGR